MKTILEQFLDALNIDYTKHFIRTLYQEHPHKYNMLGLKKMLDVYGVKTLGVCSDTKDLCNMNYPCILHIHGGFAIGLACDDNTVTYLQHGKKTSVSHDVFNSIWTGNALVVEESTEAVEPDYPEHQREELISVIKTYSIPTMLILTAVIGLTANFNIISIFDIMRVAFSLTGIFICVMLMEKQLFGESRYGDRVCSLFRHADCNSVLDGPKAKVFGISWSEVGLGYFTANILLLLLFPVLSSFIAVINCVAMLYGVWSIYYQWHTQSWCMLCVIVQVIIWAMGIVAIVSNLIRPFIFDGFSSLLSCIAFAVCIMAVHQYASAHVTEKERERAVQRYRALKVKNAVAKVLIEGGEYHETTFNDSSIIFGNPKAKMRVTILSNPHCNPCARMHLEVEKLLKLDSENICVQYIYSSFNEKLEDSSRYLISCYMNNNKDEALRKFSLWYEKEKNDYKKLISQNEAYIHSGMIEKEMEKHRIWREKTFLTETPTILVNGYKLPNEYVLADLAMIDNIVITEKNILQDINGKHAPLAAN
ncbi:vitamin K epoxide reductase family protein [Bacteroides eggerthii]|uniref:Vitamin K epoxide reductase family protein n=1 Tax=Bacteroides eggerthii TaxID=28111 RepID=A0ABT7U3F4_9BACE|nr:vitamin K epoxide reductase family protein [Bacteroides eggerthii]